MRRARGALAGAAMLLAASAAAQEGAALPDPSPDPPPAPADPALATLPYTVTLDPLADKELDEVMRASANLITLAASPPSGPIGLVRRAQADRDRLYAVMGALGYYGGEVDITIAGRPLDDPGLPDALAARRGGEPVPVVIAIEPGPVYTFGTVALVGPDGQPPDVEIDRAPLGLDRGKPARSATILAAEAALVVQMQEQGHPLAAVPSRDAVVDDATDTMDLTEVLDPGPRAGFGPVAVEGEEYVREDFILSRVPWEPGQIYSPVSIDELHDDLSGLGVFNSVRVATADALDPQGTVPVTITVSERPRRVVGFGVDYASTEGLGFNAYWGHRNLFGGAEQLRIEAGASRLLQNDIIDTSYRAAVHFEKPGIITRRDNLIADAEYAVENLEAYSFDGFRGVIGIERVLTNELRVSAGLSFEFATVGPGVNEDQDGRVYHNRLVGIPLTASFDDTNSLLDPTRGVRLDLALTPYPDLFGSVDNMLIAETTGSTYYDLSDDGSIVLAGRLTLGSVLGPELDDVPPDKRFYAGGGGSVRGYAFQSIGPLDKHGDPIGGLSLVTGSIELRYKITETIGIVPFVDAGGVFEESFPDFNEDFQFAAGLGGRYYTGFGPIRIDIATPLNPRPTDDPVQFYISLGQAF